MRGRAPGAMAMMLVVAWGLPGIVPGVDAQTRSRSATERPSDVDRDASAAIAAARSGGTVLVCRHASTNAFREREPVDYDDPATQRQLDAEGERQSRRIGEALRRLGVVLDEVVASPMHRAYRTAELMTGRSARIDPAWHTNGGSYRGPALEARRAFLQRSRGAGNTLVVSHIGTMESVLPEARGSVGEGDCLVVRPGGDAFAVIGIVPWEAWLAVQPSAPRPPP